MPVQLAEQDIESAVELPEQMVEFVAVAARTGKAHKLPETMILQVQDTPAKPSKVIKQHSLGFAANE